MEQQNAGPQFVICIEDTGSKDLVVGKDYQVLHDEAAARDDYIRVVDESGEDYLYPASYLVPIALPAKAERVLIGASQATAD